MTMNTSGRITLSALALLASTTFAVTPAAATPGGEMQDVVVVEPANNEANTEPSPEPEEEVVTPAPVNPPETQAPAPAPAPTKNPAPAPTKKPIPTPAPVDEKPVVPPRDEARPDADRDSPRVPAPAVPNSPEANDNATDEAPVDRDDSKRADDKTPGDRKTGSPTEEPSVTPSNSSLSPGESVKTIDGKEYVVDEEGKVLRSWYYTASPSPSVPLGTVTRVVEGGAQKEPLFSLQNIIIFLLGVATPLGVIWAKRMSADSKMWTNNR